MGGQITEVTSSPLTRFTGHVERQTRGLQKVTLKALEDQRSFIIKRFECLDVSTTDMDVFTQQPGEQVIDDLIKYRIRKKFVNPGADKLRADKSVQAMLAYDAGGLTDFQPARIDMDPFTRRTLYNARLRLNDFYQTLKYDWSICGFPSGESFDSSRGDNSLVAKLRNLENWKVTPSCFPLFLRVCYNTLWLKRAAKAHFPKLSKTENTLLFKKLGCSPYAVFEHKLRGIVTFWHGAKISTVPKNAETDRVIQVGCMLNMITQLCIAKNHRRHISTFFGIDLDHSHEIHKAMICDLENATIDWANASNSNWMPYVKWMLNGNSTWQYLYAAREGVLSYKGEYYGLNMLSPMGCGFTFEVMTLILLVVARELDSFAHVFGDDVIIHRDCSYTFIDCMTRMGWNINKDKTFIDGPFRESCGGFYHSDVGYITSFDFHYPMDAHDVMVLLNKIYVLGQRYPESTIVKELMQIYTTVISTLPAFCLRPDFANPMNIEPSEDIDPHSYNIDLERGIMVTKTMYKRRSRDDQALKSFYERMKHFFRDLGDAYCYKSLSIVTYPFKKNECYRYTPIDNVKSKFWIAHYFFSGRVTTPTKGYAKLHSGFAPLLM